MPVDFGRVLFVERGLLHICGAENLVAAIEHLLTKYYIGSL